MNDIVEEQYTDEDRINQLADNFRTGGRICTSEAAYLKSAEGKPRWEGVTWEDFQRLQDAAKKLVDTEKLAAAIAERKASAKEKLSDGLKRLIDNDITGIVQPKRLDAVESMLRQLMDEDELEARNKVLRKKSGGITYRDIAFVACVHRHAVLTNGKTDERFLKTSPFNHFAKVAEMAGYDGPLFDDRQVRHALDILVHLGFTVELTKAVKTANKKECRAGTWDICDDLIWNSVFTD